jgi:hypothetical protein
MGLLKGEAALKSAKVLNHRNLGFTQVRTPVICCPIVRGGK